MTTKPKLTAAAVARIGVPALQATARVQTAAYAGSRGHRRTHFGGADHGSSEVAGWHPTNSAPDVPILREREEITARARSLIDNNGWAAGGAQREIDAVIGAQFRPSPRPDRRALEITPEQAKDVAEQIECAWREWADDPRMLADATRSQTVSGMLSLAYRHYLVDGDALALVLWREDRPWHTTLRVVDPDLLSNPSNMAKRFDLRGGVELDTDGAAVAYHFRRVHEFTDWYNPDQWVWDRYERETAWGRQNVVHFFDKRRDEQTRGISRYAPIIEKLAMEDRYGRVELQAAALNAILGAFITTPMDTESVMDMLSEDASGVAAYTDLQSGFHERNDVRFNGVKIPHLMMGERIETLSSRQLSQFEAFEAAVLRHIATALGMSYEQLTSDWTKTNYSSARAALVEVWRGWTARRVSFAQRFCGPIYMAFLEEAIDRGSVVLPAGAPGFYDSIAAWCRAKWIGPGKGFVDPTKEAQGAVMRVAAGLSTMEDEAAELSGSDYQDNLAQIQREIDAMPDGVLHPAQVEFSSLIGHNGGSKMRGAETDDPPDEEQGEVEDSAADEVGSPLDVDAYGVAVRAGAITPQRADEDAARQSLGLPPASEEVDAAWDRQGGTRAPITLASRLADEEGGQDQSGSDQPEPAAPEDSNT